jgi:hypothetical protein
VRCARVIIIHSRRCDILPREDFGLLVRTLLLTAQGRHKVAGMRRDTLSGTIRLESTVDKIKLPEAHEQATPWAALLNTLVAAMFVVAFLVGLGLLVGAFLVHRVLRRIKARLRGEQLPFDQDSSSMDHKRVST